MKRYRDAARRLTMTIDQIAAATLDEASEYYQDGGRYIYEGRAYTLRRYIDRDAHGNAVEVAQFVGIDGYNLFTDPARRTWQAMGRKSPAFDPPAGEWRKT